MVGEGMQRSVKVKWKVKWKMKWSWPTWSEIDAICKGKPEVWPSENHIVEGDWIKRKS